MSAEPCKWWCASLHKPHKGPCFEMYSHQDTCPGAPDCIHGEDEEEDGPHIRAGKKLLKAFDSAIEAIKNK